MNHFFIVCGLPSLFSTYGKIFSVGEFIASGYASFMTSGILTIIRATTGLHFVVRTEGECDCYMHNI